MTNLCIGPTRLRVDLEAPDLVRELDSHIERVIGSRGGVAERIQSKWGRVSLIPVVANPGMVEIRIQDGDGNVWPITPESMAPGSGDESALGYVAGRLLCRGLVSAADLRRASPLPNGRTLPELRGVEIALIPQGLHTALGELHVIGFTGLPDGPPRMMLVLEGGPSFNAYGDSAVGLKDEIDQLIRRMAEKFRPIRGRSDRFEEPTLEAVVGNGDGEKVTLKAMAWEHGSPDIALLQWVLTHLLRPRKLNPFLPMRNLIILPREVPSSAFLPDGRHLADLPAIRNQLMPAKVAQLLGDVHQRGTGTRPNPSERQGVTLRFGPLRISTRNPDQGQLLEQARTWTQPLVELFRREGGGEEKFGPVTLDIQPTGAQEIRFKSTEFLPGCPDEILCEYVVARWLQDDTISLDAVGNLRRIGKRSVVAAPSIVRQLVPSGTFDLIENVHTGRSGPVRRDSGWRPQIDS